MCYIIKKYYIVYRHFKRLHESQQLQEVHVFFRSLQNVGLLFVLNYMKQ